MLHWQWISWSALRQQRVWTTRFWVHMSDVTIAYNNWSGLCPYLCGMRTCKADPSVGHQNRRANTHLEAWTRVLLLLLLWSACIVSLKKNTVWASEDVCRLSDVLCILTHSKIRSTVYFEIQNLLWIYSCHGVNSDTAQWQCASFIFWFRGTQRLLSIWGFE